MAPINPALLAKIMRKLQVEKSRAYARIDQTVRATRMPRHVAALIVASDAGVNISRFASESDLAMMRGVSSSPSAVTPVAVVAPVNGSSTRSTRRRKGKPPASKKQANAVFVVHGRDEKARKALSELLGSVGVRPIEWSQALSFTGKGSPYIGEVIDAGFDHAQAIIVLFTPDDEAKLKDKFFRTGDPAGGEGKADERRHWHSHRTSDGFGAKQKTTYREVEDNWRHS
ncbi:MAG: nucleotide-binding protein [Acidobacteriia bacterium]|nr:nucleotide-binding protein [Terriglobia bacterium]